MATKDPLGDRMKQNYENRSKTYLTRRTPVIIRLDGKAFHSFTRNFQRPYDEVFHEAMNDTLLYLCKNIQGCKFGYTQSDEITLVLTDYDKLDTDAWFGYGVQKMCSVAASMATLEFNRKFRMAVQRWWEEHPYESYEKQYDVYLRASATGAMFDARCFNIPKEEILNCLIWRQQDATRNAIQMLGQTYFSQKNLEHMKQNQIQDMLMLEKGINFNDMAIEFKRGVCCRKELLTDSSTSKKSWRIDKNIPIFTQEPEYICCYLENECEADI